MDVSPFPCFFGLKEFQDLNAHDLDKETYEVRQQLEGVDVCCAALSSYSLVKAFLFEHALTSRYGIYRSAIEKLLLWCLLVAKKPIVNLDEQDVRDFMDFCLCPPDDWVAKQPEKRLRRASKKRNSKDLVVNTLWRPFRGGMAGKEVASGEIRTSGHASLAVELAVINSFYLFLYAEDVIDSNPAASLHRSKYFSARKAVHSGAKSFSTDDWDLFVEEAEKLAVSDQEFERNLFLLMTIYHLFLSPADVDRFGANLAVKSLFERKDGTYGLNVEGYPELQQVIISSDYVTRWVARFRANRGTHMVALDRDPTPLISTQSGRPGISSRHANLLFKQVCSQVIVRIKLGGGTVSSDSPFYRASLSWLRETGLVQAAQAIPLNELYPSIRGTTYDTAHSRFYAWQFQYDSDC